MLTLFVQGTLVLWLVNAQDPVIFFLYALLWGFGYGGVGTQLSRHLQPRQKQPPL